MRHVRSCWQSWRRMVLRAWKMRTPRALLTWLSLSSRMTRTPRPLRLKRPILMSLRTKMRTRMKNWLMRLRMKKMRTRNPQKSLLSRRRNLLRKPPRSLTKMRTRTMMKRMTRTRMKSLPRSPLKSRRQRKPTRNLLLRSQLLRRLPQRQTRDSSLL